MKKIINYLEQVKERINIKIIAFFGGYLLFFIIIIVLLRVFCNNILVNKEYEKGRTSLLENKSLLSNNYYFDYKIKLDGILYDYYGKKNGDIELFKYNNIDYYKNSDGFFSNNNNIWLNTENPYLFYELINQENRNKIIESAYFLESNVDKTEYKYLISSNTINKLIYNLDTDAMEEANEIIVVMNGNRIVSKIIFNLNSLCKLNNTCENSLEIELNYESYNQVKEIDNPLS